MRGNIYKAFANLKFFGSWDGGRLGFHGLVGFQQVFWINGFF